MKKTSRMIMIIMIMMMMTILTGFLGLNEDWCKVGGVWEKELGGKNGLGFRVGWKVSFNVSLRNQLEYPFFNLVRWMGIT